MKYKTEKINVVGQDYKVTYKTDTSYRKVSGFCDGQKKELVVHQYEGEHMVEGNKDVFNHELMHALLFELGDLDMASDEAIVSKFAHVIYRYGHLFHIKKHEETPKLDKVKKAVEEKVAKITKKTPKKVKK